jgi:hypothetical protein
MMNPYKIAFLGSKRAHCGAPLHFVLLFAIGLLPFAMVSAAAPDAPVFAAQIPNPNDYSLFANGGWDGNWYVGYNNGWVKKLPPVPPGHYAHVYIGAKLGRMKTLPPVGRPPEFNPIPGEIWIALSSTPSWKTEQRWKLTTTDDIPFEGSPEYALENVGESEWFWTEIPVSAVNLSGDNFVAIWSPTPELVSISSAPVLAAAWGGKDVNSWILKNIKGELPEDPVVVMASGISYFQPAMALKLVPEGAAHPMHVRLLDWKNGTPDHLKPVITGSVEGESVERVWIEFKGSVQTGDVVASQWTQVGRSLWEPPYAFSLDQRRLPKGKVRLRMAAVNIWEEKALSDPFEIEVSPLPTPK